MTTAALNHAGRHLVEVFLYLQILDILTTLIGFSLGVTALGVAGTTVWRTEVNEVVAPDQSMNIAGYALRLDSTETFQCQTRFPRRSRTVDP